MQNEYDWNLVNLRQDESRQEVLVDPFSSEPVCVARDPSFFSIPMTRDSTTTARVQNGSYASYGLNDHLAMIDNSSNLDFTVPSTIHPHSFDAVIGSDPLLWNDRIPQIYTGSATAPLLPQSFALTTSSVAQLPNQTLQPSINLPTPEDVSFTVTTSSVADPFLSMHIAQLPNQTLQSSIDTSTPESVAFAVTTPSVADPFLSMRVAQLPNQTLQPSINTPTNGYLHNVLQAHGDAWPLLLDDLDNVNVDTTYHCFNMQGQLANEMRGTIRTAPSPSARDQTNLGSEMPQSTSIASLTPVVPQKKRKRYDESGREKVKKVRRLGACFRCKIYKLPCNEELPCAKCLQVKDSQKIYRGPCVRLNMDEIHIFRAGDGDHGTVRAVMPKLCWVRGESVKTVKFNWPFRANAINTPILVLNCERFQPTKELLTEEYVADGLVHQVKLPPWACRDLDVARKDIERFMSACQSLLEDEILETLSDPILLLTWNEIKRYRVTHNSKLLTHALQIYAGAMMNSRYLTPIGTNAFGVEDQEHTPHFFKKLPLPPELTVQVQGLIGQVMMDIQAQIIKNLKARVFAKDRINHWYEVFLTIFVLLAVAEWVFQVQIRFLKAKLGVSDRLFTNISFATQHMLDEWETSAFNLVGHFRCIMNGEVPFAQSWDDNADNPRRTCLDPQALTFIRNIKREIEGREEELRELRATRKKQRLEKPLAVICELFLPDEKEKEEL